MLEAVEVRAVQLSETAGVLRCTRAAISCSTTCRSWSDPGPDQRLCSAMSAARLILLHCPGRGFSSAQAQHMQLDSPVHGTRGWLGAAVCGSEEEAGASASLVEVRGGAVAAA